MEELKNHNIVPKKYYGQVFTVDDSVIQGLIDVIKSIYRQGTRIVEIGGGLGYITKRLADEFDDVDCVEFDEDLFKILYKKCIHYKNMLYLKGKRNNTNKFFIQTFCSEKNIQKSSLRLIKGDILEYHPPRKDYLLVGNIPFHISGRLYRRFMSDLKHKPYGMVFITDRQYAATLMNKPPRSYRASLQAQIFGDIEIMADVSPASVHPEPKVKSCIVKITKNQKKLPENFWKVVNYHFDNFPTKEVKSPKTMRLKDWIELAQENK